MEITDLSENEFSYEGHRIRINLIKPRFRFVEEKNINGKQYCFDYEGAYWLYCGRNLEIYITDYLVKKNRKIPQFEDIVFEDIMKRNFESLITVYFISDHPDEQSFNPPKRDEDIIKINPSDYKDVDKLVEALKVKLKIIERAHIARLKEKAAKKLEREKIIEETWVEKNETKLINGRAYTYNKKRGDFWFYKEGNCEFCISSKSMEDKDIEKMEQLILEVIGNEEVSIRIKANSKDRIIFPAPRKGVQKIILNSKDFNDRMEEFKEFFEEWFNRNIVKVKPV
ncbi:MAG: hypothetical protein HQK76_10430 [Desulfobacterales bacterium]|nr:hypothetical protein [Desulfobacterales bacterium]